MPDQYKLGLLGHPVSHSMSPRIHEAALRCVNLSGTYQLFDVVKEELGDKICELKEESYSGLNVTLPHKLSVMKYMDEVSSDSKFIGAVNTIHFQDGRTSGYNTDVSGFKTALSSKRRTFAKALVYGYGGSSRAVLVALCQLGIKSIYITGRNPEKLSEFVQSVSEKLLLNHDCKVESFIPKEHLSDISLFVNCSPMGLNEIPLAESFISLVKQFGLNDISRKEKFIFDLVYSKDRSRLTDLVRLSQEIGLESFDGYEMLIQQALKSFEIWTGRVVPRNSLETHMSN